MAGPIPDFSLPNSSFFNIYNDATVIPASNSNSPNLPNGQCNFVDLSHGASGPKCGCRRFWSRSALSTKAGRRSSAGISPGYPNGFSNGNAGGLGDDAAWCMCSHHACFHDDVRDSQPPPTVVAAANIDTVNNGQENERPRASREPLTPVVAELPFKMPAPTEPNTDFYTFNDVASFGTYLAEQQNAPGGEVAAPAPESSIPDTLNWTNLIQSNSNEAGMLPPIPSQCLMSSQPSSTTSSARIGYLRPFNGKGLGTLSGVRSKLREPLEQNDEVPQEDPQEDDTIAISLNQSMDDGQTVANTPRSTGRGDAVARQSPSPLRHRHDEMRQLSDTVQSHEQRLDRLENPSVSAAGHDVCDDRHEHSDLRITELESRVEEVEKMINDSSSQISNRLRHPGVNESISSTVSVSTVGSECIASRAELYSQLQALKSQLSQLQGLSSFPSYTRPWDVEVVFLPFPLKNVWVESNDFASQALPGINAEPDPWTQLPSSSSTTDPHSPDFSDWAGPDSESEWLLPRACAPNRTIEQRLRSRGLVKNVSVRSPDARGVHQAISEAFGTLFRTFSRMQANVHHGSTQHHRVTKFLGLQSPWVPLRKIHKDARLRFLSPPEMVTPVTWDVPFLRSSVVMKATGVQRLYITHPEAYLQDQGAYDNGWNWQRLRELSRVYADSQSQNSQEVPEADAMEDCWTWNDTLDEHPGSAVSSQSLSLRQAAQRNWRATSMSPAHRLLTSMTGASPTLGTNRSVSRAKSPAVLKERKASKPPHIRTSSLPPAAQAFLSPALVPAKRRVTSYVHQFERRPSPQVRAPSMVHVAAITKRRSTRSPSVRPRNTPRYSTASPSPMPEGFVNRATTPYYATPYSNAPFSEARAGRGVIAVDEGESGSGTDQDGQGGEYMDEDEEDDSVNNDSQMLDFTHADESQGSWQDGQLPGPEDEPWPGIEDAENRDPDETIDIHIDDDAMSDAEDLENRSQRSSVPSEYPSTHRAWTGAEEAFRVYEDGDPTGNGSGVGR